jgi:hypothetical protein
MHRRHMLKGLAAGVVAGAIPRRGGAADRGWRLATFQADVTVPIGHGMMGGAWRATRIGDPLEARGLVLLGPGAPVVIAAVDWCEIRNDAYERWQTALAAAVGTTRDRVLVSCVHQHDAPVADLTAERLLRERRRSGSVCDREFHETAVRRTADALRAGLKAARPFTHVGTGQAKVERVASNRRYTTPEGQVRFDRMSRTTNAIAAAAPEGLIDPWLKTLSFWNGDTPLAAVSAYAVHPMSHYGAGEVSADFPGLARRARQAALPGVFQIYYSGASGNVVAGKYNTGARENRTVLAGRLEAAMAAAWRATEKQPVGVIDCRVVPLRLEPRDGPGFTAADLEQTLATDPHPFRQCLAALGLSWRKRIDAGHGLEVPALDFGFAQLVLLPGEAYVEFQLAAQEARPGSFVVVAGYGECATGYIPTERHVAEGDTNLADWCWVAPGSEARLRAAIRAAVGAPVRRDGGD